jgi:hypothetical protein
MGNTEDMEGISGQRSMEWAWKLWLDEQDLVENRVA